MHLTALTIYFLNNIFENKSNIKKLLIFNIKER